MRITRAYLDQLEREARKLDNQACAAHPDEAERLRREAQARRDRIARLKAERTDDVRFA